MNPPAEDEEYTFKRTFTVEDVEQFAALSKDTQPQHTEPDSDGRLMVHGLLTATLPTKIGSDLEVLAYNMEFEFRRPVYTGEEITCTWRNETVQELDDRYELTIDVDCVNERDELVLDATLSGIIWKDG